MESSSIPLYDFIFFLLLLPYIVLFSTLLPVPDMGASIIGGALDLRGCSVLIRADVVQGITVIVGYSFAIQSQQPEPTQALLLMVECCNPVSLCCAGGSRTLTLLLAVQPSNPNKLPPITILIRNYTKHGAEHHLSHNRPPLSSSSSNSGSCSDQRDSPACNA